MLSVSNLNKSYAQPVLRDFDFTLEKGEVHALVGSNGAGKSTFARILTGLTPADSGNLLLNGKPFSPASSKSAEAAGVFMVLQELNIIPTLTVAENICLSRLPSHAGILDRKTLRETADFAGYLDGSIVAAASVSKGSKLLSEDLNEGQSIQGIEVHNPFD